MVFIPVFGDAIRQWCEEHLHDKLKESAVERTHQGSQPRPMEEVDGDQGSEDEIIQDLTKDGRETPGEKITPVVISVSVGDLFQNPILGDVVDD